MRKPAGPEQICHLQKVCRAFELSLEELAKLVPDATFQLEKARPHEKFMLKSLDYHLGMAVDLSPKPWDITEIPDVGQIIAKVSQEHVEKQVEKSENLRRKVQEAT